MTELRASQVDTPKFGEYSFVANIGAGGMAALFLAQGPASEIVAIKMLHDHLATDWSVMRSFIDEAMIAVRLRHPNVVHVEELSEHAGTYFLVMEFVPGVSLAELMRALQKQGKRLDPWLAGFIASQAATGLHAAHELEGDDGTPLGVIHSDVSPQNILLTLHGDVKVADFGIARARGRAQRTKKGELRGKLHYLAPEQARDEGNQDRRVDVFALGVVLWEMLTQRRVYGDAEVTEVLRLAMDPKIQRPSEFRNDIPPNLEGIVMNAVAASRDERPRTAAIIATELSEALANSNFREPQKALSALIRDTMHETLVIRFLRIPPAIRARIDLSWLAADLGNNHHVGRASSPDFPQAGFSQESTEPAEPSPKSKAPKKFDATSSVDMTLARTEKSDTKLWLIAALASILLFVFGLLMLRD